VLDRALATDVDDVVSVNLEVELEFARRAATVVRANVLVEVIVVFKLVAVCGAVEDSIVIVTVGIGSMVAFQ